MLTLRFRRSQKRKIVTAIGKAVNNASRLESSGIKGWIHTSGNIIERIKHAHITKDTRVLKKAIQNPDDLERINRSGGISFLEYYQNKISSKDPVIETRENISYKEY